MTAAHPPIITPRAAPHPARALPLRIGSRASPLALVQTRAFISQIAHFCPVLRGPSDPEDSPVFVEHAIRTTGDAVTNQRLADIGGKGLFAKEIHEALLDGRIDMAVHSLKDLETTLPPGIVLACTLAREDARDALILPPGQCVDPANPYACLPHGALIGTSSVRRQAQLLHARPDLRIGLIRGNVQTRLDRVANGDFAATFLALAGLRRLGLDQHAAHILHPDLMVPAAGQGIVGVTVRAADSSLRALLASVEDATARAVATAERALLTVLDGSCHTPIGGHARIRANGTLRLTGLTASEDGSFLLKHIIEGAPADAHRLGTELGTHLRTHSPPSLFNA